MSIALASEVANRVSDENSVILWNIINKFNPEKNSTDDLLALCYIMLEELK
jgi:hypothetical protein